VDNPPAGLWADPSRGRIARYAWGPDYHDEMAPALEQLAEFIRAEGRRRARYYIDTGPVLERAYAARAGLGFMGRNTMLISPRYASMVMLAEILVDAELDYDGGASDDLAGCLFTDAHGHSKRANCGSCRRCLDACPTNAFPAPYIVDSNRCISYLTIELKGSIPGDLRPLMGNWIFGCDACQEVCPWVHRYAQPSERSFLWFDPDRCAPPLLDLMAMDQEAFRERFRETPVMRAKRRGLLRNVAVALGNWGHAQARQVLEAAASDPEPLVAEHARWALERIDGKVVGGG
jgi:epoxyqueuosine reductase